MIRHPARPALFALMIVLAPTRAGRAEEPEAEARRLFGDVVRAYRALTAYADKGESSIEMTIDGRPFRDRRPMSLAFARPDRIALDAGDVRLVGDGQRLATVIVPDRTYMVAKASGTIVPAQLTEGPLGAALRGGPAGPAAAHLLDASIVLTLLVGDDPAASILENTRALRPAPDALIDGRPVKVLRMEQARGPAILLQVDPETKLLRRVEMDLAPGDLEAKVPGVALSDARLRWSSGPISTAPPDPKTFAFEPPAKYTEVAPVEFGKKPARGADAEPAHELVGKPSPDFSMTVLDGPGKTRTVTKADLAGKVVLLDFWATWCGPCLLELPEVAKLVESYAKAKKDVAILAVSQDAEPEDLKGVRKLVEEKLAEEGIALARGETGRVALDPRHVVGDAFGVKGIPMVVILDGRGVVQSVHVGFRPEVGELLATDIDSLLEGKSLVPPKPAEADARPDEKAPAKP